MKPQTRYIILLSAIVLLIVVVQLATPKPIDWTPTFYEKDKNPFGAYVTDKLLDSFFDNRGIENNNLTFYEMDSSISPGDNIISISERFAPDVEATKILLNKVESGSHAFISASYFADKFADTLGLFTLDVFFAALHMPDKGQDSTDLKFVFHGAAKRGYYYRTDNVPLYFTMLDSLKADSYIISTNAWGKPVTMRIPWGKGYFILNSTPLAFTNNYLLYKNNYRYAEETLSYLPSARTWWTSYYQLGRLESVTPLRFILTTEPLRWAYYIAMAAILALLFFESKRKQRIIPILRPLSNTTLEFVKTIANMYFHASDHKAIAEKKIAYFLDKIRSSYFLTLETGDAFVEKVARKSGYGEEKTQSLFALINVIQNSQQISAEMLLDLNAKIEDFTGSNA